jgi:hypothetical protein
MTNQGHSSYFDEKGQGNFSFFNDKVKATHLIIQGALHQIKFFCHKHIKNDVIPVGFHPVELHYFTSKD